MGRSLTEKNKRRCQRESTARFQRVVREGRSPGKRAAHTTNKQKTQLPLHTEVRVKGGRGGAQDHAVYAVHHRRAGTRERWAASLRVAPR